MSLWNELMKENRSLKSTYEKNSHSKLIWEFEAKTKVLQELEFIDGTGMVLLRGRFSREIASADAIILTTFIFEGGFKDLPIEDAGAILGFTLTKAGGKKLSEKPTYSGMSEAFKEAKDHMLEVAERII